MNIRIDGREFSATITPEKDGYAVKIGKDKLKVLSCGKTLRSGDLQLTHIEQAKDQTYKVFVDGDLYTAELVETQNTCEKCITAPIRGVITAINVRPGQKVKKGDTLLRIMAMKMDNEIAADSDCRIKRVFVKKDQTVTKGDELIELR